MSRRGLLSAAALHFAPSFSPFLWRRVFRTFSLTQIDSATTKVVAQTDRPLKCVFNKRVSSPQIRLVIGWDLISLCSMFMSTLVDSVARANNNNGFSTAEHSTVSTKQSAAWKLLLLLLLLLLRLLSYSRIRDSRRCRHRHKSLKMHNNNNNRC